MTLEELMDEITAVGWGYFIQTADWDDGWTGEFHRPVAGVIILDANGETDERSNDGDAPLDALLTAFRDAARYTYKVCPACHGRGWGADDDDCPHCSGTGCSGELVVPPGVRAWLGLEVK